MFYMLELNDIWSIYLKDTPINLFFGLVSLDIYMTKLKTVSLNVFPMSNKQSIFYLQRKKKSIYKDMLNTFDLTSKMHILRNLLW